MRWHKTSPYSIAAVDADYAVSRTHVMDDVSGELVDRFTAWHGLGLSEQPKGRGVPPSILGIRHTAAEAKALCEAHRGSHG